MAWSIVCPASRGIGFALTRHLLKTTSIPVLATARKDSQSTKKALLEGLDDVDAKRLHVLELDVTDETTISAAAAKAKSLFPPSSSSYLHLAFCLPGILNPEKSPSQIDAALALQTFRVNTLGPLLFLKHFEPFLPNKSTKLITSTSSSSSASSASNSTSNSPDASGLPPSAVMAFMAARVGSTTDNALGGWYSYRASKSGVISLTKTFDLHLRNKSGEKACAIALHPGTVKTDFSKEFWGGVKEGKLFEREDVARMLCEVVKEKGQEGRGRCWDWKGEEVLP